MTQDEMNNMYFEWMYHLVCEEDMSYRKLFYLLHDIDFTYTIDMDGNRFDDGVDLRYRFGDETGCDERMVAKYLDTRPSHELMTVNEKFKSTYSNRFNCFLFMGTNKPVKITDAKSGLIRRLIDVSPSGNKLSPKEYKTIVKQVDFELGAISSYALALMDLAIEL